MFRFQLVSFFMALLLGSSTTYAQNANSGVLYTYDCDSPEGPCVTIRLNPFYWGTMPSEAFVTFSPLEGSNPSVYTTLQPGQQWEICSLRDQVFYKIGDGEYIVTVEVEEDCREEFRIVINEAEYLVYDDVIMGPSPCSFAGITIDLPSSLTSGGGWVYNQYDTDARDIYNRGQNGYMGTSYFGGVNELVSPDGKFPPGLYMNGYGIGCTGYLHQIYLECEISARPVLVNIYPPSTCTSHDGALLPRQVDVCHPNHGNFDYHLEDQNSQIYKMNTGGTFVNLPAGMYNLWVTSEYGCSALVERYTLVPDDGIGVDLNENIPTCAGDATGQIEFTVFHYGSSYTLDHTFGSRLEIVDDRPYETTYVIQSLPAGEHQVLVHATGSCTLPLVWETSASSHTELWSTIEDVALCQGGGTAIRISTNTLGTAPYTITWEDGLVQTRNSFGYVTRPVYDDKEYCAVVTDRCGLSSGRICGRSINIDRDFNLRVEKDGCEQWIAIVDYPQGSLLRPSAAYRTVYGVREPAYLQAIPLIPDALNTLTFEFGESCTISRELMGPSVAPTIETEPSCEGLNNGKVHFSFANAQTSIVYEVTFEGVQVVLTDDTHGTLRGSVGSLVSPESYAYTYAVGDCIGEGNVRLSGSGTRYGLLRYEADDNTCFYDQFCQDEPLGVGASGPAADEPSESKRPCEANLSCNGEHVGTAKRRKRTTTSALYQNLLNYTLSSGISIPGYGRDGNYHDWTPPAAACSRVRYCTANMRILNRWNTSLGVGSGISEEGENCFSHDCPLIDDEVCYDDSNIPGGAVGNGVPPLILNENCTVVEITAKQLAHWHDELLSDRSDYGPNTGIRTLYDVTMDLFDQFGRGPAQFIPTVISPSVGVGVNQDPLFCAKVRFCRETLEIIYEDDLTNLERLCGELYDDSNNSTGSPYCIGPLEGSDFSSCDGERPGPSSIIVTCRERGIEWDEVTNMYVHFDRPIREYFSMCYPEDVFNLRAITEGPTTSVNRSVAIPPYFAPTKFSSFVTVHNFDGATLRQKSINTFGDYLSYSESFPSQRKLDHELTKLQFTAEYLTREESYAISVLSASDKRSFQVIRDDVTKDPSLAFVEGAKPLQFAAANDYVTVLASYDISEHQSSGSNTEFLVLTSTDTLSSILESFDLPPAVYRDLATSKGSARCWSVGIDGYVSTLGLDEDVRGNVLFSNKMSKIETIGAGLADVNAALAFSTNNDITDASLLTVEAGGIKLGPAFQIEGERALIKLIRVDSGFIRVFLAHAISISRGEDNLTLGLESDRIYVIDVPLKEDSTTIISHDLGLNASELEVSDVAYSEQVGLTLSAQLASEAAVRFPNYNTVNSSVFPQAVLSSFALPSLKGDRQLTAREAGTEQSKAIDDHNAIPRLHVYPLPTDNILTITLIGTEKEFHSDRYGLSFSTITGQKIQLPQLSSLSLGLGEKLVVDVTDLASGTYILGATGIDDVLPPITIIKL